MLNFVYLTKARKINTKSTLEAVYQGAASVFDSSWHQLNPANYTRSEAEMISDTWTRVGESLSQALHQYALRTAKPSNEKINGGLKYHS